MEKISKKENEMKRNIHVKRNLAHNLVFEVWTIVGGKIKWDFIAHIFDAYTVGNLKERKC